MVRFRITVVVLRAFFPGAGSVIRAGVVFYWLRVPVCSLAGVLSRRHDFMESKEGLRKRMRSLLFAGSDCSQAQSFELLTRLRSLSELGSSEILVGFLAIKQEPDLRPYLVEWLRSGRKLLLPRFVPSQGQYELASVTDLARDLVPGHYGILEPHPLLPKDISCGTDNLPSRAWLVPGLAFSASGARLGRGKGYYDRLLGHSQDLIIGVCWDCQLISGIPVLAHDVAVHFVVTESRTIDCRQTAITE